jgi:asparagine synthase (glutamine-hydrolysing)
VARESSDGVERLGQQLHTAVKQHLVSDVPLGVFLSGGIDSSAITALAVRAGGSRVQTFSIGFDESQYDESRYAKAVAEALGTHHTEVRLSQRIFRDQLPDALACIDQPTFDALNTYFVSRAVREAGITVALAGTGGDELFGGYRSFVDIPRAAEFSRSVSALPETVLRRLALGMARAKEGRFGEIPPQTRWGKLGDALATRGKTVDLYQAAYGLFTTDFVSNLLNDGLHEATHCGLPQLIADELDELVGSDGELHAISTLELACYIGQRLLRDTDAASMAVSLEARVPLLDHEVVEAVASIESGRRFHPLGRKRLLRELAMPELDSVLLDRPKAGFVLPIDVWCKQELTDEITEVFDDAGLCAAAGLNYAVVQRVWRAFRAGAPGLYWSRVWALFVLLWWCRTHRVSL